MQVLSRVLRPILAICWRPVHQKVSLQPLPAIQTTRTPTGPGQWMNAGDVQVSFAAQALESPAHFLKRMPRAKQAHTCVVNNFVWKDPSRVSPKMVQAFYSERIAVSGTFAGYLEAEVLGNMLGVQVGLWDRPGGNHYRWLTTQGVEDAKAPRVHLVNLSNAHWCALLPPSGEQANWTQLDAGGQGDCLFHALRAALIAHPDVPEAPTSAQLRQGCAEELASNASYQERIVSLSAQAWAEWREAPRLRRLWLRFS